MLHLLADPEDGTALAADGEGLLRDADGRPWPVLGGLPVLVPDPARWLATHRDAVLAALAEAGRCDGPTVATLRAFVDPVGPAGQEPLADDFLADEEALPVTGLPALDALLDAARAADLHGRLAERVGDDGPVLEVGCGAGPLTRRMRPSAVVVVDRSVRALLRATADRDATAVIGLAEALPVADGAFAAVVAANLVDLLDEPAAFAEGALRALRPGGRLVLSTPEPSLGTDDDDALQDLLVSVGFVDVRAEGDLPWVRAHGPRHVEVYVARIVTARRPTKGRRR